MMLKKFWISKHFGFWVEDAQLVKSMQRFSNAKHSESETLVVPSS
jgi:hypothetical protein